MSENRYCSTCSTLLVLPKVKKCIKCKRSTKPKKYKSPKDRKAYQRKYYAANRVRLVEYKRKRRGVLPIKDVLENAGIDINDYTSASSLSDAYGISIPTVRKLVTEGCCRFHKVHLRKMFIHKGDFDNFMDTYLI